MPQKIKRNNGYSPMLFVLVFAMLLAMVMLQKLLPDSDTYFLIATGRYITETQSVPTINPFVIHEGFEIIVQQWLFDVIIYTIYDAFGIIGIYAYSVVIMLLSAFSIYSFLGLYTKSKYVRILVTSLYVSIASSFMVSRPTSISFLMCLSVVFTMKLYQQSRWHKILLLLPFISLLTINIHAAMWPMLFVLILPFIFPNKLPDNFNSQSLKLFAKQWFLTWKWVLLAITSMIACGFMNPNGTNGIRYVFLSYGSANTKDLIMELQAPEFASIAGLIILISMMMLALYLWISKKKVDMPLVYMSLGTIVLAIMHMRNMWFLFFSALPLLSLLLDHAYSKYSKIDRNVCNMNMNIVAVCLSLVLAIPIVMFCPTDTKDSFVATVEAANYLDTKNKDEIVLYTEFNNGAYMEFRGYKVYMDARPELFQKNINKQYDVYDEYLSLEMGEITCLDFLNKYQFTHLIISDGSILSGFMQASNEYEMVVDGEGYCLYECVGQNQ